MGRAGYGPVYYNYLVKLYEVVRVILEYDEIVLLGHHVDLFLPLVRQTGTCWIVAVGNAVQHLGNIQTEIDTQKND